MKISIIGIPVLDQEQAFQFYTNKLGFITKDDIPMGEGIRWITLVSPDDKDGPMLSLEPAPLHFEPSKVYQDALMNAKIPYTQFDVINVQDEYDRLIDLDVEFIKEPTVMGPVKVAVLNDTCGNYIQLLEYI